MSEEEIVQCPYNVSHIILKPRMAAHLIKCRQQHPMDKFSICPFNSTHDVPTPELQYHTETCPDRRKLDSFVYVVDDPKPKDESLFNIELPPSTENWDEECTSVGSYLDVKNKLIENQPVFRVPVGLSRAERKAFFRQEVSRFGNISKGKPPLYSESAEKNNPRAAKNIKNHNNSGSRRVKPKNN